MKKFVKEIIIVVLVLMLGVLVGILCANYYPKNDVLGGGRANTFDGDSSNGATTTTSALSVKVLDITSGSRFYATVQNDSDTVIYLHRGYFADAMTASTSVKVNEGIRLNANGGTVEFNDNNLYVGQVWATSTAEDKVITYSVN